MSFYVIVHWKLPAKLSLLIKGEYSMGVRKHYQHEDVIGIKVGRVNQGINTNFIVYRMGETVIDSGPSNQWKYVEKFLDGSKVSQLLLTHHHEDHSGNAHYISQKYNVLPKAPKLAQAKLKSGYKTPLMQRLVWGSLVPVETTALNDEEFLADGTKIIPVHTPGHAKDLTCFYLPEKKYFFSGDLYIAPRLKLLRSDENLEQLIQSINKVLELDFDTVFCPHGGVIKDGKSALRLKKENILTLAQKAQELSIEGLGVDGIVLKLLGKEDMIAKLSNGNFCKANLIEHCLKLDIPSLS